MKTIIPTLNSKLMYVAGKEIIRHAFCVSVSRRVEIL